MAEVEASQTLSPSTPGSNSISILYFSDAHEFAPAAKDFGGFARLKTIAAEMRAKDPQVITISGGEIAGGTLFGTLFKGKPQAQQFKDSLRVDVAHPGTHDFDWGPNHLKDLIRRSHVAWITSNLKDPGGKPIFGLPETLIIERNGTKVGFFSVISGIDSTRHEERVIEKDYVDSGLASVAKLKRDGAKFIVALTRLYDGEDEKLLKRIPEIDLVLAIPSYSTKSDVSTLAGRPVVRACENISCVLEIQASQLATSVKPTISVATHFLDSRVPSDPQLLLVEKSLKEQAEKLLKRPLGTSRGNFPIPGRSQKESALGNLVSDAFRQFYAADIGVIHSAGIRAPISEGPVTLESVSRVLPFRNELLLTQITGAELLAYLQHGLVAPQVRPNILQVSGVSYEVKPTKPEGSQVVSAKIDGNPLETTRLYKVAITKYLADGYDGFPKIDRRSILRRGKTDVQALEKYIVDRKAPLIPILENRIKVQQ